MAFDSLSEKLQNVFKNLRSKGRLTEDDVKTALKEVKMALLEADVNFRVVKKFVKDVHDLIRGCLIKRQPLNTKPDSCEESGFGVLFRCETKQNASRLYSIRDWISSELAHGYRNYDPVR